MGFKEKMFELTKINGIPKSYQIIGNVMLLKLPLMKEEDKIIFAESIIREFKNVKTVCEISSIKGELREPLVKKIYGNGTETIHRENGILYKIDVSKTMFSKGNLYERKRLIEKIAEDEKIVDMFAGIGYFSLGIGKCTKAKSILAVEKNPVAYRFLLENIKLNKVRNIFPILSDSREVSQKNENYADRIIMGYFPGTEKFLASAIKMSKKNSIIHFHNIYNKKELWKKPVSEIEKVCKEMNCSFDIEEKRKVKSFAPNTFHIVIDIKIYK